MIDIQYILRQLEHLTLEQKIVLRDIVNEQIHLAESQPQPEKIPHKWCEICGTIPNLLNGEDPQSWVNHMRCGEE